MDGHGRYELYGRDGQDGLFESKSVVDCFLIFGNFIWYEGF